MTPAGEGPVLNDSGVRAHGDNPGSRRSPRQTFCGLTGTNKETATTPDGRPPAFHLPRVNRPAHADFFVSTEMTGCPALRWARA
jgi:hypothetical protein